MSDLLGADTDALDRVAESLSVDAQRVQDIRTLAQRAVAELQAVWNGPDLMHLTQLWEQEASPQLAGASTSLDTCAAQLRAQSTAQRNASSSEGGGWGPIAGSGWGPIAGSASGLSAGGLAAIAGLGSLMPDLRGGMPTSPAAHPPGTPADSASWWSSLGPQLQQRVIQDHPEWIGDRDGVPFTARDQANRALLGVHREQLLAEKARLERNLDINLFGGIFTNDDARLDHVSDKLKSLDAIEEALAKPGGRRLLLLDVGPERAEAAVASGNVDTADHVAVLVPGLDSTVDDDLLAYDGKMDELRKRTELESRRVGANESAAAVTWIGYQSPQMTFDSLTNPDSSVANDSAALSGAAQLAPFLQGIGAARDHHPHLTVLGHSYGSTTAGLALQQHTGVDDVVFFGSPGIGTNDVGDLKVPQGHTYLVEARNDAVGDVGRFGGDPSFMGGTHHASARESTVVDSVTGEIRHFHESEGHSAYLANQSTSQHNLSLIAAGLPGQVVPNHGIGIGDVIGLGVRHPSPGY